MEEEEEKKEFSMGDFNDFESRSMSKSGKDFSMS